MATILATMEPQAGENDAPLRKISVPLPPAVDLPVSDLPSEAVPGETILSDFVDPARPAESRNFLLLVIYQILMRTGWIFKTESSIMPAVVDALGGTGWMRGALPLLNRFGQSIPPMLMARSIKRLAQKKWAFVGTTTTMVFLFLTITSIWLIPGLAQSRYAALIYLVLYALFFMAIGVNQLAFNTLQGKLIRVRSRGRLLMLADTIGATTAITCALLLLPRWLRDDGADFSWIFGFSTGLFAAASLLAWMLVEEPDSAASTTTKRERVFVAAWQVLRSDQPFRRLCVVAALFSSSLVLFPHYQAIASDKLGLGTPYLMWWVVAQNIGTAMFSVLTGPLSDRFGNRLSIRILTILICLAPQTAMLLSFYGETGKWAFAAVFVLVGMTPVAQKTFNNYTLELTTPENHPRYLSTLSLCMAVPILFSILVGHFIDWLGFTAVYHGVTVLMACGALLSFRLIEPRSLSSSRPILSTTIAPADDSL